MYVPDHFKISDRQEMLSFLDANAFGQLISIEDNRPAADHQGVIDNLEKQGSAALVMAMRKTLS
jgi:predicted FMN-binding regulatory protein PaiB